MVTTGTLYLIPNVIAEGTGKRVIPSSVTDVLKTLTHFLAEDVRTARRYFSSLKIFDSIEALQFSVLNKNTVEHELGILLGPLMEGHDMGIVSESGCPGIADPGAIAVAFAHRQNIRVVPLVGPSSILLALMASGLNGQKFAFHGYLPIDGKKATQVIRDFEHESKTKNQTQVFIETPYRTDTLFRNLLATLGPSTKLCIALDLSGTAETITCKSIRDWKLDKLNLPKTPAIFLFLA